MSEYLAMRILRANPSTTAGSGDRFWLRIVQEEKDDRLTPADAAQLADALYDIDPCLDPADPPAAPEPVTEDKLYRTAADVFGYDLAGCRAALSGEYSETVKVIRSHPRLEPPEPYELELSAGEVVSTVTVRESVAAIIDVSGATSADLEYPVVVDKASPEDLKKVKFYWQGDVIGETGLIAPPVIDRTGNTIYWEGVASGSINARYPTEYDMVTIRVPGVPLVAGSEVGSAQDIRILAYWHMMVFPGEITKPTEDNTVSKGDMRLLCGYLDDTFLPTIPGVDGTQTGGSSSSQVADDDQSGEAGQEPDDPYGCMDWGTGIYAQKETYAQICCNYPDFEPYSCIQRHERRPGASSLSQDIIDKYTNAAKESEAQVEFIPVSPDDPDGCGVVIWRLWINPNSCCDEATPIVWDDDNSVEVLAPETSGVVFVTGGISPYKWVIRGVGFSFSGGHREETTNTPYTTVYASASSCGSAPITVTDNCTLAASAVRSTVGRWVANSGLDAQITVAGVGDTFFNNVAWKTTGQYRMREDRINKVGMHYDTEPPCAAYCESYPGEPSWLDKQAALTGRSWFWDQQYYQGPAWYESCQCFWTATRTTEEWVC